MDSLNSNFTGKTHDGDREWASLEALSLDTVELVAAETPTTANSVEGTEGPTAETTVNPHKRPNRSGAAKRRARKAKRAESGRLTSGQEAANATAGEGGSVTGQPNPADRQPKVGATEGMGLKRNRPSDSTPPEAHRELKKSGVFPKPTSYKDAAQGDRKVVIAPSVYLGTTLSREQGDLLVLALGEAMDAIPQDAEAPRFEGYRCDQGLLWVTCTDDYAKQWLKAAVGKLSPWEGASLKLLERENLPRLKKMTVVIPGPWDKIKTEVLLKRLERQNKELLTARWRICDRKDGQRAVHLVLGVDPTSHGALQKRGFVAHLGLGRILFREVVPGEGRATGPSTVAAPDGPTETRTSGETDQPGPRTREETPPSTTGKGSQAPPDEAGDRRPRGRPTTATRVIKAGLEEARKGTQRTLDGAIQGKQDKDQGAPEGAHQGLLQGKNQLR